MNRRENQEELNACMLGGDEDESYVIGYVDWDGDDCDFLRWFSISLSLTLTG